MRVRETPGTYWARIGLQVSGPLATLAMVLAFDVLTRNGASLPGPFVLLLIPVVWSASRGGLRPGILSAVFVMLYSLHYFSRPGSPLTYSAGASAGVIAVLLAAPATAILAGALRQRELDRGADAPAAEPPSREPALIDEPLPAGPVGSIAVAGARQAAGALADWCAIYLAEDPHRLRCAAAAHRDPARAPLMQDLQRLTSRVDGRVTPAGVWGGATPSLLDIDVAALAALADSTDELHTYRSLAPAQLITVPLISRGRAAGVLELGTDVPWTDGKHAVAAARVHAARIADAIDGVRQVGAVEDAERRYRMLFEGHPNPMWVFDAESLVFLDVNDSAIRHYGYSRDEFLRMTIMDVIPDDDEPGMLRSTERPPSSREGVAMARHQKKDGSAIDVEIVSHALVFAGRPARLALVTDVTDRARTRVALHQSEEQLRKAQKMDAVGRLASGVAHDFNNILTAIRGYSDLLLRDAELPEDHRQDVEEIRRASQRGELLTRQLLTFGRRQSLRPAPILLNDAIRGLETLLQRLVGADIQVETVLAPDLGYVRIDAGQIEQVILNLVLNARDAMPTGGTLTIETGERQLTTMTRGRNNARPGRYVMLTVSDTGSGMDDETRGRIFEPFFTTRPTQSTGLGLAIVHGIVKGHGGVIRVASEADAGTAVRMYLPRLDDAGAAKVEESGESLRGLETVLLVEDEEAVRALLRKVLTANGYAVLEARHGRDAMLVAERHRGPVHLLVTDVVMPEMGGRELAERLAPYRPEMKVLYISGYTSDEVLRKGVDDNGSAFVQKPFTSDELLRQVRGVLDGGRAQRAGNADVREA